MPLRYIELILSVVTGALVVFTASGASAVDQVHADAIFSSYDPTGCINTEVSVFVRAKPETLHLSITRLDECQDIPLVRAEAAVGLSASEVNYNLKDLRSVSLITTVPMYNQVLGESLDVNVDVSWAATEAPIPGNAYAIADKPGKFTKPSKPKRRTLYPAQASGSISSGGDSFALGFSESSVYGSIVP